MIHPDKNDVVVRQKRGNLAQAVAYAKHQHVRAWFAKGDDEFVLLGTFREEHVELARSL